MCAYLSWWWPPMMTIDMLVPFFQNYVAPLRRVLHSFAGHAPSQNRMAHEFFFYSIVFTPLAFHDWWNFIGQRPLRLSITRCYEICENSPYDTMCTPLLNMIRPCKRKQKVLSYSTPFLQLPESCIGDIFFRTAPISPVRQTMSKNRENSPRQTGMYALKMNYHAEPNRI